eukprot:scaffold1014_cov274-Chaetoceros_neogracile.AAC.19
MAERKPEYLPGDDVRVLGFDKSADTTFVVSSSIAFFLFLVEIAVQCWCRDDYIRIPKDGCRDDYIRIPKDVQCGKGATNREKWESFRKIVWIGSFYFWLDLMATLSMIFELPWMASVSADGVDDNFDNARASKASRAGAKAARI